MHDHAARLWQQALDPLDRQKVMQAVELDPTPTPDYVRPHPALNAWHLRASALMQMGRIQAAADCYRRALSSGDESLELLLESGICLYKVADIAASLQCLERAIQLFPQDGRGFIYRAEVWLSQDRVTEALESFEQGLTVQPSAAGYWAQGNAYRTLGRYPEALDSYRRAWRMQPETSPGQLNLRQALIGTLRALLSRQPDPALTQELLQLDPQDGVGRLAALRLAHRSGQNQGLLAQLESLPIEDNDMLWRVQELRASLLLHQQRWQEAAAGWCQLGDYNSAWPILRERLARLTSQDLPAWIDLDRFRASLKKGRLFLHADKQLSFEGPWTDSQCLQGSLKLSSEGVRLEQPAFCQTLVAEQRVLCAAFSGDGQRLLTVESESRAVLWECSEGRRLSIWQPSSPLQGGAFSSGEPFQLYIERAVLDRAGERALLGLNDGSAQLFEALSGRLLFRFCHPRRSRPAFERIRAVAFSPDGHSLAVGFDHDRTVGIWQASTGQLLALLQMPMGERQVGNFPGKLVCSLMFSPCQRYLFAHCQDEVTCLWDLTAATVVYQCAHFAAAPPLSWKAGERLWDGPGGPYVGNPDGRRHASFLPQLSPDGYELLTHQGWFRLAPTEERLWTPCLGRNEWPAAGWLGADRVQILSSAGQRLWRPR